MVKCDNCGEENSNTAVRCKKCGQPLNSIKGNSSNTKLIAIVAIVVIISIVGVFASGMLSNNSDAQTDVQSSQPAQPSVSNNTTAVDNNTASSSSSAASTVVASSKTDKFHRPDCEWAQKISDSNKITYPSRNDAISAGKIPCSICNP